MSPPMFLLGTLSISTVWVITSLGLPPDLCTFGVIPVLSVYFLCDHRKLWEAAVQARGSWVQILSAAITVLSAILCASFTYIRDILWKVCVLFIWLLSMVKAFDFEKNMYMIDTFGAVAKFLVWTAITTFTGEAMWMSYKGEWAYCSPYRRKLVDQEIDHYYALQTMPEEQEEIIPESYDMNFPIESCNLHCVYTAAAEGHGGASGDYTPTSADISSRVENLLFPLEKARADTESALPGSSPLEGESSSSKGELGQVVVDDYKLVPCHVSKVEVSLEYQSTTLEGYTFYDRASDAVAELKRVLKVLRDEGNVIFSSLNRDIGSSRPRAHARCHEFGELLELILNRGYKLQAVDLREKYKCTISGHWNLHLRTLLLAGTVVGINFFQLTGPPKNLSTTIFLLTFYALVEVSFVLWDYAWHEQHKLRRFAHFIISRIAPSKMDDWYRYFQVHAPWLTFCNESYCYPYTSSQSQICMLESNGAIGSLPVTGTESPNHLALVLEDFRAGEREFDLRNLQLELSVAFGNGDEVLVEARMRLTHNLSCCYREYFQTKRSRAADLIALMKWLEKYSCVGVCKEWPETRLMYAYGYKELFRKVLLEGSRPMIITFHSPIDIRVE